LDGAYKRIAFTEGTSAPLTGVQTSNYVLVSTVGGSEATVTCKTAAITGTMENPEGGSAGIFKEVKTKFGECTVAPSFLKCQIPGGAISTTSMSGAAVSGPSIQLKPESGEVVGEVTLEKCIISGLNKTYVLKGTLVGAVNNEASSVEFTKTSGSSLTLNGEPATLTGTSKILSEEMALFVE
jgi:hypothetical protein